MRQGLTKFDVIRIAGAAGQRWQRGRCDGDAEHADRKLHKAKCIAQPGHGPVEDSAGGGIDDLRGKVGVDENIDLHGCSTDDRRTHETHDLAYSRIVEVQHRPVAKSGAAQARPLNRKLEKATNESAKSHSFNRAQSERWADGETEKQSADHRS